MSTLATTTDTTTHNLSSGDTLAESGDWPMALVSWGNAVAENASLQPAVEQRLSWFLRETGHAGNGRRFGTVPLVLFCGGAAAAATACVLLAGDPGTTAANLWATAAWMLIAISVVCAILAARGPGGESFEDLMHRARTVAAQLDDETTRNGSTA